MTGFRDQFNGLPGRRTTKTIATPHTNPAEAMSIGVLTVLDARGLRVPSEVYDRVMASTNLDELGSWLRRAAWIDSAESLFV